jgi:hypothetical protein
MHLVILIAVALATLVAGFLWGMFISSKRRDEAFDQCTRPAPHLCRENGPCNGLPKPISAFPDPAFPVWMQEWKDKAEAEKRGEYLL